MGDDRTRPLPIKPAARQVPAPSPETDPLLQAAIDAGLAGELNWTRVGAIVEHLVEHDWLTEHGDQEAETC